MRNIPLVVHTYSPHQPHQIMRKTQSIAILNMSATAPKPNHALHKSHPYLPHTQQALQIQSSSHLTHISDKRKPPPEQSSSTHTLLPCPHRQPHQIMHFTAYKYKPSTGTPAPKNSHHGSYSFPHTFQERYISSRTVVMRDTHAVQTHFYTAILTIYKACVTFHL